MSAVYKVMEQMQKTRPRRLRGNREVMLVLGGIVIVGMLLLVNSLNKRLKADNQRPAPHHRTQVKVGPTTDKAVLTIQVSLNEDLQWVVPEHGVVSEERLIQIFSEKRSEANERGMRAVVRAQISGDQPAKHFLELHRIAEDCKLDEVNVETQEPLLENVDS